LSDYSREGSKNPENAGVQEGENSLIREGGQRKRLLDESQVNHSITVNVDHEAKTQEMVRLLEQTTTILFKTLYLTF